MKFFLGLELTVSRINLKLIFMTDSQLSENSILQYDENADRLSIIAVLRIKKIIWLSSVTN